MPMFPLGVVLLPGAVLPLFLFEPRYLQMYSDIVDGDRDFGVVLIERGSDSGGGDTRFGVGCVAHMVGSAAHEDGRVSIVTVGTGRIRVLDWQPADPYPLARVELVEDDPITDYGTDQIAQAQARLTRLMAHYSELGADVGFGLPDLDDDPRVATYQIAQVAGLQPLDLQKVLEAETSDDRALLVNEMIKDQVDLVELQMRVG